MKNKIITIITVCLNSSSTIKNTLNSLLNQNFTEFEYIVIDGNSNDGTLNILSDYKLKFKKKKFPTESFQKMIMEYMMHLTKE